MIPMGKTEIKMQNDKMRFTMTPEIRNTAVLVIEEQRQSMYCWIKCNEFQWNWLIYTDCGIRSKENKRKLNFGCLIAIATELRLFYRSDDHRNFVNYCKVRLQKKKVFINSLEPWFNHIHRVKTHCSLANDYSHRKSIAFN